MNVLKSEISVFDNAEFQELLEKRNTFVHNFHKEYYSVGAKKENELPEFLESLEFLTEKHSKIFIGLLSVSTKNLYPGKIDYKGLDKYEINLQKLIEQKPK